MPNKPRGQSAEKYQEFTFDLDQGAPDDRRKLEGEIAALEIVECAAKPCPSVAPPLLPLSHRLQEFLADEALLDALGARQLQALVSLAGNLTPDQLARLRATVAQRRRTDPSNPYVRLLADELDSYDH